MKRYLHYLLIAVAFIGVVLLNLPDNHTDVPESVLLTDDHEELKVISFSSPHCGACKDAKKEFEKIRSEIGSEADFETIDVTKDMMTTDYYNVSIVPTVLITQNGIEIKRLTGSESVKELSLAIKKEIGFPKYCEDGSTC